MVGLAKHQPVRMCGACRTRLPKTELQRYVILKGVFEIDSSKATPGRGIYSCSNACFEQLQLRANSQRKKKRG